MTSEHAPVNSFGAELRDATVAITGVGRRGQAGEVVAAAFAARGATVALIDRDGDSVRERAADVERAGGRAAPFVGDLTDPAAAQQIADRLAELSASGLKAVVHMAGGYVDGAGVADTDPAIWHKLIAINLTTAFTATRAFLPLVRQARGAMVYFASAAALPGASVAKMSAYAAAKGGVITLMRAVAAEEKANGVRANALAPQAIRTAENLASMGENKGYVERETIAAWVVWLCSELAGPVTGQVVRLG